MFLPKDPVLFSEQNKKWSNNEELFHFLLRFMLKLAIMNTGFAIFSCKTKTALHLTAHPSTQLIPHLLFPCQI